MYEKSNVHLLHIACFICFVVVCYRLLQRKAAHIGVEPMPPGSKPCVLPLHQCAINALQPVCFTPCACVWSFSPFPARLRAVSLPPWVFAHPAACQRHRPRFERLQARRKSGTCLRQLPGVCIPYQFPLSKHQKSGLLPLISCR